MPICTTAQLCATQTAEVLKLENENPTGSMKDRMALAMIEGAERDGAALELGDSDGGGVAF